MREYSSIAQPAVPVLDACRCREVGVRLRRLPGLLRHRDAVLRGRLRDGVDEPFAAETPRPDGEDHRRPVARADDHVGGPGRAVDEVPRLELALLLLDNQHAAPGEDEKALLPVLGVIPAQALAGLE